MKKRLEKKNEKGFIAFVSLLVISAVTLAIAVSVSILGIREADSSLGYKKGVEITGIAQSCVEEALLQIRNNPQSVPGSLNVENGSCTIGVTGQPPDYRIIIQATLSGTPVYTKKIQADAKREGTSVSETSWEEIP